MLRISQCLPILSKGKFRVFTLASKNDWTPVLKSKISPPPLLSLCSLHLTLHMLFPPPGCSLPEIHPGPLLHLLQDFAQISPRSHVYLKHPISDCDAILSYLLSLLLCYSSQHLQPFTCTVKCLYSFYLLSIFNPPTPSTM